MNKCKPNRNYCQELCLYSSAGEFKRSSAKTFSICGLVWPRKPRHASRYTTLANFVWYFSRLIVILATRLLAHSLLTPNKPGSINNTHRGAQHQFQKRWHYKQLLEAYKALNGANRKKWFIWTLRIGQTKPSRPTAFT